MNKHKQFFVGIDVSKPYFDASLMAVIDHVKQDLHTQRFSNDSQGLKAFDKWLREHRVSYDQRSMVVIENTGIYHRLLWMYCSRKGLPLHIGNAAHIKWSFGIARGKNDVIDSKRLCLYAAKEYDTLKASPVLNPDLLKLKDLMTSRSKLLLQLNGIKRHLNELKTSNDKTVQTLIENAHKQAISGLKASIAKLEAEIKKIVESDETLLHNYRLLITVPGIGHLTAVYILCCTNNFHSKITGKQLACYAGVVPFEHSSGISVKGRNRVHKMANKELKSMLHLSSLVAIQRYPEFTDYYLRKKAEGKHTMSVLNAIKNKIILRAAAVVNNQQPYQENHPYDSQIFRKKYLEKA
jgi:transposase